MNTLLQITFVLVSMFTLFGREGIAAPNLSTPIEEGLHFVIYYEGDFSKEINDKSSTLGFLLNKYELQVVDISNLDTLNRRVILEPTIEIEEPADLAKIMSLTEHTLMVEVLGGTPNTPEEKKMFGE